MRVIDASSAHRTNDMDLLSGRPDRHSVSSKPNGSNDMQLSVFINEDYGHVLLAAVQNLELMLQTD